MKEFIRVMLNYVPPYKKWLYYNVFFNILSSFFSVFSIITIIPILKILFGLQQKVYGFVPLRTTMGSFSQFGAAIQHNIYSYITHISDKQGGTTALIIIGIFLVIMVLFKVGFLYIANFNIVHLRNAVIRDIRNGIYTKIVSLPIGFFTEEHKGDIMSRVSVDIQDVEASIMNSLDLMIKNPIAILIPVIAMIYMSWQLTIFVFVLFPISGLIIGRIGKSLRKRSLAGQNKMGELLNTIEETLSGLRIIKAFNAEYKIQRRFKRENEDYRKIMNRLLKRRYLASPLSELLGTLVIIVVVWFGGNLILTGQSTLDPAKFLAYIGIFYLIINPAKSFSQEYYSILKGLASMERINRILNVESTIVEKPDAKPAHEFSREIRYENVTFRYKTDYVLKDVNIRLEKGKTIALVGHSGSGKSTLVDLLPRFYDVEKGRILIDGVDIRDLKIHDLRSLMGIVNQDPILFNDTFFNNIAFGVDNATEEQVIAAAHVAHAHEFIEAVEGGYYATVGDRGSKLSGGQRQRISIARAVLKNPPILILDEATSALDTESEKLVQDALTRLMENRTSIVIAHRLSTIVHADEIYVIQNGVIIEQGKHEKLLEKNGEYRKFYTMQYFS